MITQGSKEHPLQLDPFHIPKEVHWVGGIGVMQVDYPDPASVGVDDKPCEFIGPYDPGWEIDKEDYGIKREIYKIAKIFHLDDINSNSTPIYTYDYYMSQSTDYSSDNPANDPAAIYAENQTELDLRAPADAYFKGHQVFAGGWPGPWPPFWSQPAASIFHLFETFYKNFDRYVEPVFRYEEAPDRRLDYCWWVMRHVITKTIALNRGIWIINYGEVGGRNIPVVNSNSTRNSDLGEYDIVATLTNYPSNVKLTMNEKTITGNLDSSYQESRKASYYKEGTLFSFNQGGFV